MQSYLQKLMQAVQIVVVIVTLIVILIHLHLKRNPKIVQKRIKRKSLKRQEDENKELIQLTCNRD